MISISEHTDLTQLNSFGVTARGARLIRFSESDELPSLREKGYFEGNWMVLSGGNNVLFTQDYSGTLFHPEERHIEVLSREGGSVRIKASAGVEWDDLVELTVANGWWGAENLSLIPGWIGAAPVQNIGAYGAEAKQLIESVDIYLPETGVFRTLDPRECNFGYRESIFKHELKGRAIVTAVTLRFSESPRPELGYGDLLRETEARGGVSLRNIRDAVIAIRRSKLPDPKTTGNAGSFFKNPTVERSRAEKLKAQYPDLPLYPTADPNRQKLAAGWMIERAGWKGRNLGRAGVHDRQALVLINLGGATGQEIIELARAVQHDVEALFGIRIETEVNII